MDIKSKYPYCDNTGSDTRRHHTTIMEAIKNGGKFEADFADIFVLTKTPIGSACEYALSFFQITGDNNE